MRRLMGAALTMAAAATMIGLTTTAALAAPTSWTGSPGGSYTSSLHSTNAVLTVATGLGNVSITCTAESDKGSINTTASGSPTVLGTITSTSFTSCRDSFGDSGWTAAGSGTWSINGYHYNDGHQTITGCSGTGVSCGTITGVTATATGKVFGVSCSIKVTGSVGLPSSSTWVTYTNSTGVLSIPNTSTLTVASVTGCGGAVSVGNTGKFTGSFSVSPTQTITGTPAG